MKKNFKEEINKLDTFFREYEREKGKRLEIIKKEKTNGKNKKSKV